MVNCTQKINTVYIRKCNELIRVSTEKDTIMDESFTLTITGNSSVLEADYFPPIELPTNKNCTLGLVELFTFNAIPNVDDGMNKIYVGDKIVIIPAGSYEIEDIERYVQKVLASDGITLNIKPNNNTLRSEIKCSSTVNFQPEDSIGQLLGFTSRILEANKTHTSDLPVAILKVNALHTSTIAKCTRFMNSFLLYHQDIRLLKFHHTSFTFQSP